MVDDVIAAVLELLLMPFEPKFENFTRKIRKKPKAVKIIIEITVFLVLGLLYFGIVGLYNHIVHGYWI